MTSSPNTSPFVSLDIDEASEALVEQLTVCFPEVNPDAYRTHKEAVEAILSNLAGIPLQLSLAD